MVNIPCKYCKESKVNVCSFNSYCYWLEYPCKYESNQKYVKQGIGCCNYSKMNIFERIYRFIKIIWYSI